MLIGDAGDVHVKRYDGEGEFDYVLAGPNRGEFALHTPEIPDLMEMLEHMLGDG